MRFYSKWYCATLGVDVLARSFRLASNRYIVRESAYIKVCPYQVMIRNGELMRKLMSNIFFLKYFAINYILNFMYIYIYIYIMLSEKCILSENTMILHMR